MPSRLLISQWATRLDVTTSLLPKIFPSLEFLRGLIFMFFAGIGASGTVYHGLWIGSVCFLY